MILHHPEHPKSTRDTGWLELFWRSIVTAIKFPIFHLLHPNKPYLVPEAIEFIEQRIKSQDIVMFEYGTGTSTIWWSKRVKKYVGVEHDNNWYNEIISEITENGIENADIIFTPKRSMGDYNWKENWKPFDILGRKPEKPEFLDYIRTIDQFPDHYFDLICIDGRERVGAAAHALSKIKEDGVVIFDDSSRPRYQEGLVLFSEWKAHVFDMGLQQTTIFTPQIV